jgi:transitional endoplasmic reticulum ATPase
MPLPDAAAREALLAVHTRKMPLDRDVDRAAIAAAMAGAVGADIAGLCRRAALACLARAVPAAELRVSAADFANALNQQRESNSWRT